jgi:hypothetical protein
MYNQKNEAIMYIDNDDFSVWMQKLYAKLEELCKDVRVLRNADRVLPEDDNLLDNQDLCLLFKVSIKTLQRYRAIGALPYFTISGKVYYKASDVREFIKERFSATTLRQFEKEHARKKRVNLKPGRFCSGFALVYGLPNCRLPPFSALLVCLKPCPFNASAGF